MDCMRKSDAYFRRKELMEKLEVPMMSEITDQLEDALANVFFKECPDALKPEVGIEPKLVGPVGDLWISPSDLLIGKVVLKPPLTNRYVRALTHQGLLEIGSVLEVKLMNEMRLEKEAALRQQEEYLNFLAERKLNNAVAKTTEELNRKFEEKIKELMEEFEIVLSSELDKLESLLRAEFQETMRAREEERQQNFRKKLEMSVGKTVEFLTNKYLQELRRKEEELQKHYTLQIHREKRRLEISLNVEERYCQRRLKQLKHNLECKSIANLMYILCMERRKYHAEIAAIESRYKEEIEELEKVNTLRQDEIESLVEKVRALTGKLELRREFLTEILKQFQKFINFALRATPTQAEFLLNVEKMMLYELTNAVEKFNKKVPEEFREHVMAWKSDSEVSANQKISMHPPDYHNCRNELSPPPSSRGSNDYMPAFYYNNKLYVAEDFRNMVSQNITISRSNLLWNKDVENLMTILKESVEKISRLPSASHSTHIAGGEKIKHQSSNASETKDTKNFNPYDTQMMSLAGLSLLNAQTSMELMTAPSERKELRPGCLTSNERLAILGATDSLQKYQMLKEQHKATRQSSSPVFFISPDSMNDTSKHSEANFDECVCTDESLEAEFEEEEFLSEEEPKEIRDFMAHMKRDQYQRRSSKEYKKSESHPGRLSKISLHVDSIELLRASGRGSRVSTMSIKKARKNSLVDTKYKDIYTVEDSPMKLYRKTSVFSQDLQKKSSILKKEKIKTVVGNPVAKEQMQESKEFTADRITSILNILKKEPSLMRMFTSCTR